MRIKDEQLLRQSKRAFFSLTVLALGGALFLTACEHADWGDDAVTPSGAPHDGNPSGQNPPGDSSPGGGNGTLNPAPPPPTGPFRPTTTPKAPGTSAGPPNTGGSPPSSPAGGPSGPTTPPASPAPETPSSPAISFAADLVPMFQAQCIACHAPPYSMKTVYPKVEFDVLDYQTMKTRAGVLKERVWDLKDDTGAQGGMPMNNPAGLTDEQRQLVKNWVESAQAP